MKKLCISCNNEKNITEFRKDRTRKDGHQTWCKICAREKHRSWYTQNYKHKNKERDTKRYREYRSFLDSYKLQHPCWKCGEIDICCLQFHHLDSSKKEFDVSNPKYRSIDTVIEEINKCIVVCSNCHKKLHAGRFILEP